MEFSTSDFEDTEPGGSTSGMFETPTIPSVPSPSTGTTNYGDVDPPSTGIGGPGTSYTQNPDGTVTVNPDTGGGSGTGNITADTSGLGNLIKSLFSDGKGGIDILKLGALGGGLAGLFGGTKSSSTPTGYQGSIPKYTATRNMVTAPEAGRRPGAGGTRYGGDVTFTPKGSAPVGGGIASLIGSSPVGGTAPVALTPAAPQIPQKLVTQDDPFYQSPEYKAYLNDPSNMIATADMYDSPYFGRMSSGSVGSAMDSAYEKYKGIAPQQNISALFNRLNYAPMNENQAFAEGGSTGRYLQGGTDGMADKIPAQIGEDQPAALSHGEFVIPADVVSHLGNGNSDAGAQKLYAMMDKIREARTGTKEQGKQINPDKFMPGGSVQHYAEGGISGVGTAANAGVTGTESNLSNWAGPYVTDMLGKGQALSEMPYQEYGGPLTAGGSGLQNKVFSGLSNVNFPSNLGASFSSAGAYRPPQMNMGAYQPQPISAGTPSPTPPMMLSDTRYRSPEEKASIDPSFDTMMSNFGSNPAFQQMLNQGSNGLGDFGNMQATTGLQNQGPAQPGGTYEDYLQSQSMFHALPQTREQFDAEQNQLDQQRQQGMGILGRGNMSEIMAGLGGKPGQMPQGGLAGLIGRMPQQPQQPQQGIAQQYMNPYLQSVLDPQMAELRRQNDITNMGANAKLTGAGAFGGGRQAIINAENNRNLMQEMNKTVGQGYSTAYDKAMQQFNTEQGQGMGLANLMAGQGAVERGIESEGIAADKAAFEEARANPYKMVQFQQSLLSGLPLAAQSINTAQPSTFANTLTGAGSVASLLNNLGLGKTPATPAPKI